MSIIDANGLFGGNRWRGCSNPAQLHWPRLFLASDGFGRLELNYHQIIARAYATFNPIPSEMELQGYLQEYARNSLLFVYGSNGQVWGQWDTPDKFLPDYKTAIDKRSPIPPEPQFTEWKKLYRSRNIGFTKCFENVSQTFPSGRVLVGYGIGKELVETHCSSDDERGVESLALIPQEPKPVDEVRLWFDAEFWPAYPRKVGKPQALKAARRHGKTAANRQTIMECLLRRIPDLQAQFRTDGDYRPYPERWLNLTPWMDPEETARPAGNAGSSNGSGSAIERALLMMDFKGDATK